jgi:hypothetical protein
MHINSHYFLRTRLLLVSASNIPEQYSRGYSQELMMKFIRSIMFVSLSILLSPMLLAADKDDHIAHHASAAVSSTTSKTTSQTALPHNAMTHEEMEKIDSQIKVMRNIHTKMMNATSTEERKQHMAEHMKAMQGGMSMMGDMPMMCDTAMMNMPKTGKSASDEHAMMSTMQHQHNIKTDSKGAAADGMKCSMGRSMEAHHQMMAKRMQLMETLVQMMMDRMTNDAYDAPKSSAVKK